MKSFTIFALAGLVASVAAIPQETAAPSATLSPAAKCATECGKDDVCCQAACYDVPCPNEGMANKTTECAMKCPQGSGTPQDTIDYAKCQQECIKSYFFSGTGSLPAATGGSGSSPTGSDGATITGTGSGSDPTGSANPTGGDASSTSSSGLAPANVQLGSTAAGVVGLLMAALAL
ncbi:hypothetical protein FQN55_008547 [Onygenales sp. PD_40]|nr:hypothetical protein FQN55_008547 [Onygenales sp. PD_40]KAK2785589.1 hypothetical protein FQN52_008368 [Onygenales sp. PD_12]KAK2806252.1 hypothetical protein FQN51_007293 [Onygenales sp. PD_10]